MRRRATTWSFPCGTLGAGNRGCICCPTSSEQASASGIRESLHHGVESRGELDPAVAAYIREHGLYKEGRSSEASAERNSPTTVNCRTIESESAEPHA